MEIFSEHYLEKLEKPVKQRLKKNSHFSLLIDDLKKDYDLYADFFGNCYIVSIPIKNLQCVMIKLNKKPFQGNLLYLLLNLKLKNVFCSINLFNAGIPGMRIYRMALPITIYTRMPQPFAQLSLGKESDMLHVKQLCEKHQWYLEKDGLPKVADLITIYLADNDIKMEWNNASVPGWTIFH